jgi:hypothetical protein
VAVILSEAKNPSAVFSSAQERLPANREESLLPFSASEISNLKSAICISLFFTSPLPQNH